MKGKCEICQKIQQLNNHHIKSKCYGGSNKPHNRAKLCPNCHADVHSGDVIIEGRFNTSNGNSLIYRNLNDTSITGLPDPKCYIN